MYNYPDPMISISLDRQAEKVRKVQAYGLSQPAAPVAPAASTVRALATLAVMVIGTLLLVYVAR